MDAIKFSLLNADLIRLIECLCILHYSHLSAHTKTTHRIQCISCNITLVPGERPVLCARMHDARVHMCLHVFKAHKRTLSNPFDPAGTQNTVDNHYYLQNFRNAKN